MPTLNISDPETGACKRVEIDEDRMRVLIGRRIGEIVDGAVADMPGYKLQLTGGCDKDGFPMRPDIHGGVKVRVLLSGGPGYKPRRRGERRKKMVRGNTVTRETVFLNLKIVERPGHRRE
ncbi:MAG: 30S ribosomal protein S6e [Candidatus Bathyarchaeota archaeon B23]|nr:MAG: 30S ribosomal protein S6e [Candidatus Bathyarchaeota archaeon B23]